MYDDPMKPSALSLVFSRKSFVKLTICLVFCLVATGVPAVLHADDHGAADASCKVCQLIQAASAFVAGAVIVLYALHESGRRPAVTPALQGVNRWHHQPAAPRAPPF
jgi:hypothetical protein